MLRAVALAASLVLIALLAGACGGGAASGEADPATAVPANAPFFAEFTVRPEGGLRDDALAATGKVLATPDPEARIRELVDQAFAESDTKLSYERDVAPWLGETAAVWAGAGEEFAGVVLLSATDTEEAQSAIDDAIERGGERTTDRSHGGVDYRVDGNGSAIGIVGDFAALGTEPELKRTIDALEGSSLAEADRYRGAIGELEEERLAHFYADLKALFELAAREDPATAQGMEQLRQLIPLDRLPPLAGAFMANGERLALDMTIELGDDETLRKLGGLAGGAGTPLLAELPAGTWLAQGYPKLGETLRVLFGEAAGAFGGAIAKQQIQRELGLDLDRDILSWIGDAAVFVRGESVADADGGVVIEVTDEGRAADAFGKIVGALRARGQVAAEPVEIEGADAAFAIRVPGTPKPIVLARGSGKVVGAYGEAAAAEALAPDATLGDEEIYADAEEILGAEPGLLVSMPAILSLVESAGEADAEFERARPYLEAYTVIATGGTTEGDRARARVAAGLK
jgi:hypothetical protein